MCLKMATDLKKSLDSHSSAGQEEKEKSKGIKAARLEEEEEAFTKSLLRGFKERECRVQGRSPSFLPSAALLSALKAAAEARCAVYT